MEAERVELLSAVEDQYGGVVVNVENHEPMDPKFFSSILEASMYNWRQQVDSFITFSNFNPIERFFYVQCVFCREKKGSGSSCPYCIQILLILQSR